MATMELVLSTPIEQLAPKLIAWNNAELLAQVNKSLENYKGKVYDENSIAEAKTDRAALNLSLIHIFWRGSSLLSIVLILLKNFLRK